MKSNSMLFEILVKINNVTFRDINYCCVIKTPFIKMAPLIILKLNIPQPVAEQIYNNIAQQKFPKILLYLYSQDMDDEKKSQNLIYMNELLCINVSTDEKILHQNVNVHTNLLLVNQTLYELNNTNVYNVIKSNITAYDSLIAFEEWLKQTKGDIFNFNHIGSETNKNDYLYEQILIKSINDLNVPNYLINTYKINNDLCCYFFDNFIMSKNKKKTISTKYINLAAPDAFIKVKQQYADELNIFVKYISEQPIADITSSIVGKNNSGYVPIFNQQDIKYSSDKKTSGTVSKKVSFGGNDINMINKSKRNIDIVKPGLTTDSIINQSVTFSRIYCPDNIDNGQKRFDLTEKFINSVKGFELYEASNCLPDFPQFGYLYTFNNKCTPCNICNIFVRKSLKEYQMYHISRFLVISYF